MIPKKLRTLLEKSLFMEKCKYFTLKEGLCNCTEVEWHHALQYRGQIQKWYAIIPLCLKHHRGEFGTISQEVKEYCEYLAIKRGLEDLKMSCPRYDWEQRLLYIRNKYE